MTRAFFEIRYRAKIESGNPQKDRMSQSRGAPSSGSTQKVIVTVRKQYQRRMIATGESSHSSVRFASSINSSATTPTGAANNRAFRKSTMWAADRHQYGFVSVAHTGTNTWGIPSLPSNPLNWIRNIATKSEAEPLS